MRAGRLPRNAIKEAFDNLPSGICFFDAKELLVLCNRTMHHLVFEMTGRDLQVRADLADALAALPQDSRVKKDGDLLLLPDGTVWQFVRRTLTEENYTEYIATNVTELYRRKKELQISTAEYKKMVADMKHIVDNVTAITREEEILAMKMRIHGKVGICLQQLRQFHVSGCPSEGKQKIVSQLEATVNALRGEIGNTDEIDALAELLRVAGSLGVTVSIEGEMPTNVRSKNLIIMAMRECITNTLRHAQGDAVSVTLTQSEQQLTFVITNNGEPPTQPFTEGGGLTSLRRQLEKAGGKMKVQSLPVFALTGIIPKEREGKHA